MMIKHVGSFNTASGMDCMQYCVGSRKLAGVEFQYRKRYGLHAMSYHEDDICLGRRVSIPQAVWIACNTALLIRKELVAGFNTASGMDCMQ